MKFVLLIHDVYPEVLVASGICGDRSFIVRLGDQGNRWLYRSSAALISLGRDMSALAGKKLKDGASRIYTIPNWADGGLIPSPKSQNRMIEELGIQNKFVILYAGNIGRTHGIEYLVDLAEYLKNEAGIHFLFLGFGAKRKWLDEQVKEKHLSNVTLLDPKPRKEQQNFLNACDLAIISFIPGMSGVSVPSRMYNQLAVGKPILAVADQESELAQLIVEENVGWIVSPGDSEGLREATLFAASRPDLCKEMGLQASKLVKEKYSCEESMRKYRRMFREILIVNQT